MKHPTTEAIYRYWDELRGERLAPRRFEIVPSCIGELLPDTFILERSHSEDYPFRLAGTRLCERLGGEFRGRNFLDGWSLADQETLRQRLGAISRDGGAALFTVRAKNRKEQTIDFEMIVLPLIHTKATADRFLGALSALQTPDWLGYETVKLTRVLTAETIGAPSIPRSNPDRQLPFLPHIRTARIVRQDRRQFRVYEGGRGAADADD